MSFEALDELDLEWTLARGAAGDCPADWQVVSVEAVAGSEISSNYTWAF